jgi:hypothetical protein
MEPKGELGNGRKVDLRDFKERLRRKLPPQSPTLSDLLLEPDSMPIDKADVLIPHYLKRLERGREVRSVGPPRPSLLA